MERDCGNCNEIVKPQYDISIDNIIDLTAELLLENSEKALHTKEIVIEVAGDSKFANLGRYVESVVFEKSFGNDSVDMAEAYKDYEKSSRFNICIDTESSRPIGAIRIIENADSGLKTLNDISDSPFNVDIDEFIKQRNIDDLIKVWDVGTVAVLPEFQSSGASILLFRAMYTSALRNGIDHIVSVIDEKPFKLLTKYFSVPFVPIIDGLEPLPYMGSNKSHAVYGYVPRFFDEMSKSNSRISNKFSKIFNTLVMGDDDNLIVPLQK